MDWRHIFEIMTAGRGVYSRLVNMCVWAKDQWRHGLALPQPARARSSSSSNGDLQHLNNVQLGRFGRNRTNVWNYPGINTFGRKWR